MYCVFFSQRKKNITLMTFTLLKYKDDPDETTPQPTSGVTTCPPITSCHIASSASWDSKSDSTVEERGDEGWHSVPEKPSSHLEEKRLTQHLESAIPFDINSINIIEKVPIEPPC